MKYMKLYKKIFIGIILSFLLFGLIGFKTARAITIDEIKSQIAAILAKISEIQKQLDELVKNEAANAAKSITLVSPSGGEKWETGKTYDIKWNTTGYLSDSDVQIKISNGKFEGDPYKGEMAVANVKNNGIYIWKIPELLNGNELLGSLYKISVSTGEENNKLSSVSNNYFSIIETGLQYPSLNIISPKEGEVLEAGKTYTIKWDYPNSQNYRINIVLRKGSANNYGTIITDLINASSYNWNVSQDLIGTGYGILISAYDESGNLIGFGSGINNITIIRETASKNIENQLGSISQAIFDLLRRAKELINN